MSRKSAISWLALSILAWATPVRAEPYRPQNHLVELGMFAGLLIPSKDHQLYDEHIAHQPFKNIAFDFGLRVAYLPLSFLGAEFEGAVMPTLTSYDDKSALLYHLRFHAILQYPARVTPFALAGGGWMGLSSSSSALGKDIDLYPHWGLGLKVFPTDRVALRLDGRHVIGGKRPNSATGVHSGSVPHFEILLGVSYVLGRKDKPKPKDTDGDGIIDERDKCPTEAGEPPDGCPKPKDTDGDGIIDEKDKCPTEAGEPPDGCPKPKDTDGDGIIDEKDKCPTEAGEPPDGCPKPKDTDGDGITDDKDKCPNEPETKNGFQDEDGCPDELPQAVKQFTGAIKGITFDFGKATIRKASFPVLDAAVKVLSEYSGLRVMVRGHTDNRGKREKNLRLSEERAKAVVDYLVKNGIAIDRLTHEGLGPDEPVADNKKAKGRAENRRIEFKIVTD